MTSKPGTKAHLLNIDCKLHTPHEIITYKEKKKKRKLVWQRERSNRQQVYGNLTPLVDIRRELKMKNTVSQEFMFE